MHQRRASLRRRSALRATHTPPGLPAGGASGIRDLVWKLLG